MTAARRVALHQRVAEAIETIHADDLDDHLPALAHHWARVSSPAAQAIDYATRAGDRALAQLAHDEAVAYYRQALELREVAGTPADRKLCELMISLGEAQRRAGESAHRDTLLRAARLAEDRNDSDALGRAALANNRGIFTASERVDEELVSVLELALDRCPPADSSTRARLLALLAEELTFSTDNERRSRIADEALSMARRVAEPSTLAHVLVRRYTPLVTDLERHAELVELAELARRLDDPALVFWADVLGALASFSVGDVGRSGNNLAHAAQLAEDTGQPVLRWFATFFKSAACRIAGELEAAEAFGQEAFEIGRAAGMADAFAMYAGNMFFVRYDQGRLDEMLEVFERAASRPDPKPVALAFLGLIYCELGRLDDAQPLLNRLAADEFRLLPKHFAWTTQLALTAEICASVGAREHATTLRSLLLPYRDLLATTGGGATGAMAHHLGLLETVLERFDEADAHFAAAASRHAQIPAPAWLARTRLEWARMLLTRRQPGDDGRARELLGQALTTARDLGLGGVERQAIALIGEPP